MKAFSAAVSLLVVGVVGSSGAICSKTGNDCNDSVQLRKLLEKASRIVGGSDAEKGRFPYMVSLMNSDRLHLCGGVLIDKRWVLTVAHCFGGRLSLSRNPFLLIGALNRKASEKETDGVEEMIGAEVIIHEKYEKFDKGFDIALVKLPRNAKSNVFVNLPDAKSELVESHLLLALGWGRTGRGPFPNILQQVDLEVLSNERCQSSWDKSKKSDSTTILDSMMCTFSRKADTCSGDSGGPLLEVNTRDGKISEGNPKADIVHGLVSFGASDCSEFKRAGVNTRVASYKHWILQTMGKETEKEDEKLAPVKPATPPPPLFVDDSCPNYTVKSGDTCSELWVANGLTEEEFREGNPELNQTCDLRVGDELCLTKAKGSGCSEPYVVEIGDNCFNLRVSKDLSQQEFEELNPNLPPSCLLFPGQTICLG